MTVQFQAHFENGVIIPDEKVDLPAHRRFTVTVEDSEAVSPTLSPAPLMDPPSTPRPAGGLELLEWWAEHRIRLDPAILDKIVKSKAYTYYEEPDDEP